MGAPTLFGALLLSALLPMFVPAAHAVEGDTSSAWYNRSFRFDGSYEVAVDGRRADRSSATRQDWNATAMLDFDAAPVERDDVSFSFSGSLTGDLDGRRPGNEPGIYNGIQETFDGNIQPWLYRAHGDWKPRRELGGVELESIRLGRQYQTGGEGLWFDGAQIEGGLSSVEGATASAFGGVPVRFYESATGDWLAGGSLGYAWNRARVEVLAYHIREKARFGWERNSNVGRFSATVPIGERATAFGTLRAIGGGEADGRLQLRWSPGLRGIQIRADARAQFKDRSERATELDLASLVHGRAIGASRRSFEEFGLAASLPLTSRLLLDLGGTTRKSGGRDDIHNLDFDRLFATLQFSDLRLAGRPLEFSATIDAYESVGDWTRTATGEASLRVRDNLRLTGGTSYAIYSYDYATRQIRDNVRIATAKIEWTPRERLRLEGRYDIENDDQRVHHFVRMGVRREF